MTTRLSSVDDFLARDSAALANTLLDPCPICGRKHPTPFKAIRAGRGAVSEIPGIVERVLGLKPRRPVLIFDEAIRALVEGAIFAPLSQAWSDVRLYAMRAEPDHLLDSGADNGAAAAEEIHALEPDLLVAGGSGVICDLTKYIATILGVPFVLAGTAPSMNGYTSITATITENGVKVSKFLNPADAVVLDVDILEQAPLPMVHSGIGDLTARAVCNADWRLGNFLKGSSFCPLPYQMTGPNEARYLARAADLGHGRAGGDAAGIFAEAVLLSGLSMTVMEGETSPSSGAEHVLSHFWDLLAHVRGIPKNFHGAQVGVGTVMMLRAYELARAVDPGSIDPQAVLRRRPTLEAIEAECRAGYGDQAEAFIEVARKKRIPDGEVEGYIRGVLNRWDDLWAELDPYLAPREKIEGALKAAGAATTLAAIRRTPEQGREALLMGNIYRPRYTLLDLLWELGLFPEMAENILEVVV